MTKRIYPPPANERPFTTRIQLPVTHVVMTPQCTRQIELNAPPEVIAQLLKSGWHLVEDRTAQS